MRKCPYRREETRRPDGTVIVSGEFAKCYERECPFYDFDAAFSLNGPAYCKRAQLELEQAERVTKMF